MASKGRSQQKNIYSQGDQLMMRIGDSAEELLELLWIAEEEDSKKGLEPSAAAQEDFERLSGLGLVEFNGESYSCTEAGKVESAMAIRRHRLGERLLADVFGMEDNLVDDHACRLEHALFDGLDESICTLLGHPRFCPHGKPIPPNHCCEEMKDTVSRLIAPLSELQPGAKGQIAYLQMSHPVRLQKLMAMGVLPGVEMHLVRRSPAYVFEVGYSQFAVDEEIAADIHIRLRSS
jgi:DtxR family Mn-dependent transcriptional regulator